MSAEQTGGSPTPFVCRTPSPERNPVLYVQQLDSRSLRWIFRWPVVTSGGIPSWPEAYSTYYHDYVTPGSILAVYPYGYDFRYPLLSAFSGAWRIETTDTRYRWDKKLRPFGATAGAFLHTIPQYGTFA